MKVWELFSVCRSETHILERLGDRPEWSDYLDWAHRFNELVGQDRRDILDLELPDEACEHVLLGSGQTFYQEEGYVRCISRVPDGEIVPAVEVFRRYGGRFLEDVLEYGLERVPATPD